MISTGRFSTSSIRLAACLAATLFFAGCGGGDSAATPAATIVAPSTTAVSAAASVVAGPPVTLQGTPPTSVTAGNTYSFQPKASASSTAIAFSISGQPTWAHFDTSTGALSGTPSTLDEGTTGHIVITAGNGTSTASLTPFSIQVIAPASSTATLSWTAPTENTDGTPITNLAGYRILYGTDPSALTKTITIAGANSTAFEISGLVQGTYYFAVVAYDSAGLDGDQSMLAIQSI